MSIFICFIKQEYIPSSRLLSFPPGRYVTFGARASVFAMSRAAYRALVCEERMPCSPARASRSALRRGPSRSGSGRSEELAPSESPSSRAAAAAPPRFSPPRTAGKVTLASLARAARLKRRSDHFLLAACAVHVFSMSSACLQTTQFFRQHNRQRNRQCTTKQTHPLRQYVSPRSRPDPTPSARR